jgi:hypothetical protein
VTNSERGRAEGSFTKLQSIPFTGGYNRAGERAQETETEKGRGKMKRGGGRKGREREGLTDL